MDRRAVFLALAALACGAGGAARAQPARVMRVALFVSFGKASEPRVRAVAAALLGAHGFSEGRNLSIAIVDYGDRMAEREWLARDLVATRPDVILLAGSGDALLFQRLTREIPIVFAEVGDPEGLGLVESLARPGGNITGASSRYGDLLGKRFELLKALGPRMRRIAVIEGTGASARRLRDLSDQASAQLGLVIVRIPMADDSRASVDAMLAGLARSRVDGVVYSGVRIVAFVGELLAALQDAALPAVFSDHEIVAMGGLMSLGEQEDDAYRRAVALAARILRGGQPATLPVDQLARPHLAINLKTARAMKLAIPDSIRLRADQVVD